MKFIILCFLLGLNLFVDNFNLSYNSKELTNAFNNRNETLLKNINYFSIVGSKVEISYNIGNKVNHIFSGNLIKNQDEDRDFSASYVRGIPLTISFYGLEDQHTLLLKTEKYFALLLKLEGDYLKQYPNLIISSSDTITIKKELEKSNFSAFIKILSLFFILYLLFQWHKFDLLRIYNNIFKKDNIEKETKNKTKISLEEVFSSGKTEPKIDLYNRNFYGNEKEIILGKIKQKIDKNIFSDLLKSRIYNELAILENSFEKDKQIVLKKLLNIDKELDLLLKDKEAEENKILKEKTEEASENILKLISILKK